MHSPQEDIADFHRDVVGIPDFTTPAIRRPALRAALIEEEARETVEAILRGDLVEAIDGLCDLLAVTYGAAAEFGIDLAPFWDEVHRTNMAKAGGPLREDGKRLKPPGWTPPDIAGLLRPLLPTTETEIATMLEQARDQLGEPTPESQWAPGTTAVGRYPARGD